MKARIALAVVSVLALAVLGFWLRASTLESRAYEVSLNAFQVTKPGPLAQARSDYRRAERHNPDTRPLLLRGDLLFKGQRYREAAAVLRQLVREEPQNVDGWALLAASSEPFDRAAADRARARLRALNPLGLGNNGG